MGFYKFFRIKGPDGANTGYFVPGMYQLHGIRIGTKIFGLSYVKDRLAGWTYWWVDDEKHFHQAIKTLNELKKTRIFDYQVCIFEGEES